MELTWCDRAGAELRRLHHPVTDLSFNALVSAALAHDIAHSVDPKQWPADCLLALADHIGTFATGAEWKRVLASGKIRPPTLVPRQPRTDTVPVGLQRQAWPTW